jgi:lactoylglutathione lyase
MEKSLSFYQEILELPLKRRFSPNGIMDIAFLGNEGESEIELICESKQVKVNSDGISIGFMTRRKIETIIELLEARGHKILSPIVSPNPAMRFFYASDPDGYRVQFIEDLRPI